MRSRTGFTLVEVMIVVAIIALLALIAVPGLLRAKMSANDSLAQSTLKTMSTATETFQTSNNGQYPANETALTGANPPYLPPKTGGYCGVTLSGYAYTCTFASGAYTFVAAPTARGTSGSSTYTLTTGGVLTAQ